ncbi:MAG: hypothetical protein QOH57_3767 [Mycobacterium sp.]|nr:hypothetical protein [Mycobacterium sp.]
MSSQSASRFWSSLVLAAAVLSVVSCASGSNSGNNSGKGTAGASGSSPAAGAPTSAAIDACALISADDITALLGTTVPGKSTSNNPAVPACSWENPANYESVSLEIGNPGTAPNNTLPKPPEGLPDVSTPGPDGMRSLGSGQVEFAAGNRSNSVQVAVLKLSADEANAAAVDLARKVAPKIPD